MKVDSIGLSFDSIFSSLHSNSQKQGGGLSGLSSIKNSFGKVSDIADTAATDIANKALNAKSGSPAEGLSEAELAEYKKQTAPLKDALVSTIKFAGQEFGDKVATIVAAMLYKNTSSGMSEENLGQGLLEAASFIDKKLGIESGDKFLAHLNTTLNPQLNDFFDNGQNEVFIAVNTGDQSYTVPGLSKSAIDAMLERSAEASTGTFKTLFDSLKLSLDAIRQNNIKQDQTQLIQTYDRNGQPLLSTPESGFLMDEAI